MEKQYGFYFDADRCVLCRACEVACKAARNIEPGIKWMRVIDIWGGVYPNVTRTFFALACMHCGKPTCINEMRMVSSSLTGTSAPVTTVAGSASRHVLMVCPNLVRTASCRCVISVPG